jgi:hypothetical protein
MPPECKEVMGEEGSLMDIVLVQTIFLEETGIK